MGQFWKKLHAVININQKAWLEPYIKMSTDLRKIAKNDFEIIFFKLMNNAVFRKTIENVRKHRDIKLVTTERRRNYLVSEPNYITTKFSTENLLAISIKKTQILMNKPVYLGLSILDISKTIMNEFWYDHITPKRGLKAKLCYMDTESFIVYVKTEDIYKDITEDVEKIFDTSDFEIDRPLHKGENKKVIRLMKDELGRQIIKKYIGLSPKTYSSLKNKKDEGKKAKDTKTFVIKRT